MEQFFPKLKKIEWFVLIGIVILFLAVTTLNLTRLPIFVDEALYLRWAQIAWHDATWRFISLTDGKQPLYIWFTIPFMKLIADPLAAGRMASVISGLFTVIGMGYLGWLLGNKKTAIYAMLLSFLSPYLFFYYRFGIMESTMIASIIWVVNLSVLLAKTRRLDVALILGMVTGLSLLVKSSALFYCLLIPAAYILEIDFHKPWTKRTFHFAILVIISWVLAFAIYNIQRLSPWMHMIGEKNSFFTVAYREIFAEPQRLFNNLFDVWRWQFAYTTWPILSAFAAGIYLTMRRIPRTAWLILIWLVGPMLGTIALARLFAPRYIIFVTPFILLFAAFALSYIKVAKSRLMTAILISILPLFLISKLVLDPIHYPYVSVDEGYVNGWSAGNGSKQIADWLRDRSRVIGGKPITIYTEGTFGILPHGLELYAQGIDGLVIEGIYPIIEIPPTRTLDHAKTNPETYFVMNNTVIGNVPEELELVAEFPKLRDNPMRLFRVVPR